MKPILLLGMPGAGEWFILFITLLVIPFMTIDLQNKFPKLKDYMTAIFRVSIFSLLVSILFVLIEILKGVNKTWIDKLND